jgi:hypothetical protein
MECELVVYTHSDYSDIWPIVLDALRKNTQDQTVCIAVNSQADCSGFEGFTVYRYNDANPYAKRLAEICSQSVSDYLFFFHDVDVLMSFDSTKLQGLLQWIQTNAVDRFLLGVLPSELLVEKKGDLSIGKSGLNVCNWFTTPYDVGPSIWKRQTMLDLMTKHSDETYRSIESSAIQEDLAQKNVYGFCKSDVPIRFTVGRPFTSWFSFCHILVRGKWIPPLAYQSYTGFFITLPERYGIDIEQRGIADYYHGMANGLQIS